MATKRDSSAITNGSANKIGSSFRIPKKKQKQEVEPTEFELIMKELEIETRDIRMVLDRMLEYPWTDPPKTVAPRCIGFDY